MYERNPRDFSRRVRKILGSRIRSGVHLHDLASERFRNFVHGRFETHCMAFRKQVFARYMGLHFHHFVFPRITLFDTEKHFTILDLVVEGQQLLELGRHKVQQRAVGVKMNGMNLNLHKATG